MKHYLNLITDLENDLTNLENQQKNLLVQTELAVKSCKQTLSELQKWVEKNGFDSINEEMEFFKSVKPKVVAKLIYYIEYFNIQSKRPKGVKKKLQLKYLNTQIIKMQEYYNLNMEFYYYYLKDDTSLDRQYFFRTKQKSPPKHRDLSLLHRP
ncbi:RteC domain-containing protein [Gelidibacter japonicus]|uniref:RteC domain-containing protein n=1 Tax=Gelidibacter japonicus TaxID=1962232 RepID=UPI0013D4E996|nr:RteC domain-containing protein [Gelidibacter japonicus]